MFILGPGVNRNWHHKMHFSQLLGDIFGLNGFSNINLYWPQNQESTLCNMNFPFFVKHPINTFNVPTLLPFLTYLTTIFLQPFRPTDASTLTIWNLLSDKNIIFSRNDPSWWFGWRSFYKKRKGKSRSPKILNICVFFCKN